MNEQTNKLLIEKRIRNRMIEYLDLVSSFEAQQKDDDPAQVGPTCLQQ